MYCKTITNRRHWVLLLTAGIISLAFGIVGYLREPGIKDSASMLLGMFTGLGGVFAIVGLIRLIDLATVPAGRIRQAEIHMKDERNIQVRRAALAVSNTAATLLFVVMAFVFTALDYRIPAYIAVGALLAQVVVFMLAHGALDKKM